MHPAIKKETFNLNSYKVIYIKKQEDLKELDKLKGKTIAITAFTDGLVPGVLNVLSLCVASDDCVFFLPFTTKNKDTSVNMYAMIDSLKSLQDNQVVVQNLQFMVSCFGRLNLTFKNLVDVSKLHRDRGEHVKGNLASLAQYHLGVEIKDLDTEEITRLKTLEDDTIIKYSTDRAIIVYQIYQRIKQPYSLKSELETVLAVPLNNFCVKNINFDAEARRRWMETATGSDLKLLKQLGHPENSKDPCNVVMGSLLNIKLGTLHTSFLRLNSIVTKLITKDDKYADLIKARPGKRLLCLSTQLLQLMAYCYNLPDDSEVDYLYSADDAIGEYLKNIVDDEILGKIKNHNMAREVLKTILLIDSPYQLYRSLSNVLDYEVSLKVATNILMRHHKSAHHDITNPVRQALRDDGYYEYLGSKYRTLENLSYSRKDSEKLRTEINREVKLASRWRYCVSISVLWLSWLCNVLKTNESGNNLNLVWFNSLWTVFEIQDCHDRNLEAIKGDRYIREIFSHHQMPMNIGFDYYFASDLKDAMKQQEQHYEKL